MRDTTDGVNYRIVRKYKIYSIPSNLNNDS